MAPAAILLAGVLLLVFAAPSPAPVPPRKCGEITVKSNEYLVKADRIRCKTARKWSRRHLNHAWRPDGYRCRKGDSASQLKFRCWKNQRTFFAVKR